MIICSTGFCWVVCHFCLWGVVLSADQVWEGIGMVPFYVGKCKDGRYEMYYWAHWFL